MELKIKKCSATAVLPTRGSVGSAGADLYADISEPLTLQPGGRALVPTGIAIALPDSGYVAYVFARSGLAIRNGITLSNCVGVIDSDYRGEIKVGLVNQSDAAYTLNPGERFAQLVISPVVIPTMVECDDLDQTDRGAGGFGSTGKK